MEGPQGYSKGARVEVGRSSAARDPFQARNIGEQKQKGRGASGINLGASESGTRWYLRMLPKLLRPEASPDTCILNYCSSGQWGP